MEIKKSKWGGLRPGSGRPRGEETKTISVRLSNSAMDILNKLGAGNRSSFVEKAILEKGEKDGI